MRATASSSSAADLAGSTPRANSVVRHAAVCDLKHVRFGGWLAWATWLLVHIAYLIEYDNRLRVLAEWAWSYFTRKRGARLITGNGRSEGRI